MSAPSDERIAQVIMDLAHQRGRHKTFCPSEVARAVAQDWRPFMGRVRAVAATLPIRATQKGDEVDALTAKGPIRFSLSPLD